MADITAADARAVLAARGAQNKTARLWFAALSRFFDWCIEEEHVRANLCAQVPRSRRPRAPAPRSHYLKLTELARFWMAAETATGLQAAQRDLMRFLVCIPCRLGEARTVDWAHLDLNSPLIKSVAALSATKGWAAKLLNAVIGCAAHEAAAFCQRAGKTTRGG